MNLHTRTGAALRSDIDNLFLISTPIIEEFFYEQTVLMLAAEPGAGKSVIATQLALSASSGVPFLGHLTMPKPRRVYYLQLEGAYAEFIERIRMMEGVIPLNTDNLCWDPCEGLNVMRPDHIQSVISRITAWGAPDIIIIDPIYMAVVGGLSKDEPASAFVRFSNLLKQTFHCAIILVHHTHRPRHANDGKLIDEDDPFYGSQWLKAHVDVSYLLRRTDKTGQHVALENKKSRGTNVKKRLELEFDPTTFTCHIKTDNLDALERVLHIIRDFKKQGKDTTFYEVLEVSHLSVAHLRRLQMRQEVLAEVEFIKSKGKHTIWKPK